MNLTHIVKYAITTDVKTLVQAVTNYISTILFGLILLVPAHNG